MSFEQDLERLRRNDATLTQLELMEGNLTDEEARYLADALKTNATLTFLDLNRCQLTTKGWVRFKVRF